jgi:cystathionine beta-lyase
MSRKLGMSPDELMNFMVAKAGMGLNNGTQFGKPGEGFMRMNVACPRATLKKALKQLEEAVSKL